MSAPQLLLLSGEEVHVDISEAADCAQLHAMVADYLETFTPCLSLLHEDAVLSATVPIEEISVLSSILITTNAEVHDLCVQLQTLDAEIKSCAAECAQQAQQCDQRRQEVQRLSCLCDGSQDVDGVLARAQLDLIVNTHSLQYEKQAVAHITALEQTQRLMKKAMTVRSEAMSEMSALRTKLTEMRAKAHAICDKACALSKSETCNELVGCYCDLNCRCRLNQCDCYSDYGYSDYDCYSDYECLDDGFIEDHAKAPRRRVGTTKKDRGAFDRLRHAGKVRPRGGRHKADEKLDLKKGTSDSCESHVESVLDDGFVEDHASAPRRRVGTTNKDKGVFDRLRHLGKVRARVGRHKADEKLDLKKGGYA